MPVLKVNKGRLIQRCANCGAEHEHRIADLVLGVSLGGGSANKNAVALPRCMEPIDRDGETVPCKTHEFLSRTWDECPTEARGGRFDRQRRAINAVAQLLRARGQSHPDARAAHDRETKGPPDIDELPDEGASPIRVPVPALREGDDG